MSRPPAFRAPRTAADWLGANDALREATARNARLVGLQRAIDAATGGTLRLTAIALADGVATVTAPGAAAAAKLRQMEPTLRARLQAEGWAIERFHIRTQPPRFADRPPRRIKPPIPAQGLDALDDLARSSEEGPMKEALARLLRRHRSGR